MIEPKEPVPPTTLDVKRMAASAGRPDGLRLPKASFVVRVAVIEEPEVTVLLERVTAL